MEFNIYFIEFILVWFYIVLKVKRGFSVDFDVNEVEDCLVEFVCSWSDWFYEMLIESFGEDCVGFLYSVYFDVFFLSY